MRRSQMKHEIDIDKALEELDRIKFPTGEIDWRWVFENVKHCVKKCATPDPGETINNPLCEKVCLNRGRCDKCKNEDKFKQWGA